MATLAVVLLLSHLGKRSVVGFGGELGSVQKFSSHEQSEYPDLRERGHSFCPDLKEQQNLTNCEALRRNKKENVLVRLRVPREIVLLWLLHLTPSESPLPVLVHARCPLSSACLFSFQEKALMCSSHHSWADPNQIPPPFQIFPMCWCFSCSCGQLQTGTGDSVHPNEKQVLASRAVSGNVSEL